MKKLRKLLGTLLLLFIFFFTNGNNIQAASIANTEEVKNTIISNIKKHNKTFKVKVALNGNHSTLKKELGAIVGNLQKEFDGTIYLTSDYLFKFQCFLSKNSCDVNFTINYHTELEEYKEYISFVKRLISTKQNLSFTEKVKFVNDYLIDTTSYDYAKETPRSPHTPVKIYKEGLGVCQAYAMFAYDMLNELGIENYLFSGYANGELHLWNILKDEKGNIVHLDVTWNDTPNRLAYFMISSQAISATHTFSQEDLKEVTLLLNRSTPPPNPYESFAKDFFKGINKSEFLGDFGDFPVDKAFSIKFNKYIDTKKYTTKMFITDKKGNIIDVDTKVDGKSVRVSKSKGQFEQNKEYYLVIMKNIESKKKFSINSQNTAYIKFNIK